VRLGAEDQHELRDLILRRNLLTSLDDVRITAFLESLAEAWEEGDLWKDSEWKKPEDAQEDIDAAEKKASEAENKLDAAEERASEAENKLDDARDELATMTKERDSLVDQLCLAETRLHEVDEDAPASTRQVERLALENGGVLDALERRLAKVESQANLLSMVEYKVRIIEEQTRPKPRVPRKPRGE
jgi:chromosome segregation ATPase